MPRTTIDWNRYAQWDEYAFYVDLQVLGKALGVHAGRAPRNDGPRIAVNAVFRFAFAAPVRVAPPPAQGDPVRLQFTWAIEHARQVASALWEEDAVMRALEHYNEEWWAWANQPRVRRKFRGSRRLGLGAAG